MILWNERIVQREEVKIDFEDRGYQFGDGVYEVIRVYSGKFFEMDFHLERLKQSAEKIDLAIPYSFIDIKNKLIELIQINNIINGTVYVQVTRGTAPRTHHFPDESTAVLIAYTQESERPINKTTNGISAILTEDVRWLCCDIKSLNLLPNVLAKQKAKKLKCDEALLHRGEIVSEGSSSNVFIVNGNVISTHPANNLILNGITRKVVFQLARENHIEVREEPFTIDKMLSSDEIFITSTTFEISPVIKINDTKIGNGIPGIVTQTLQKAFDERI
ncbi:D-amino-acid transaminase [Bacillus sp. JJ1503]|uniref:D-amino-acid transaminase n=1 Tax=unclassified Bacillus (in: firmicutes) TaxID=185979 RepID=UPI00300004E8